MRLTNRRLILSAALALFAAARLASAADSRPPARYAAADADLDAAVTREELIDLHTARWESKDLDRDGQVSKEEYLTFHRQQFNRLDADGDGRLSGAELDAWTAGMAPDGSDSLTLDDYLSFHQEHFGTLDQDRNGFLSKYEVTFFHSERFDALDANRNNQLCAEEQARGAVLFHIRRKPSPALPRDPL